MFKYILLLSLTVLTQIIPESSASVENKSIKIETKRDFFSKVLEFGGSFETLQSSEFWNNDLEQNSMALVDLILDEADHNNDKLKPYKRYLKSFSSLSFSKLHPADQLRLFISSKGQNLSLVNSSAFIEKIYRKVLKKDIDKRTLYTLLANEKSLDSSDFDLIIERAKSTFAFEARLLTELRLGEKEVLRPKTLKDVIFHNPDLDFFRNGKYSMAPKLYMFCRKNRNHPCMMIMKDGDKKIVLNKDRTLWAMPTLGLGRLHKPFNKKNGNTPAGVYTIDSVMPAANKKRLYGKFRRLILNFIPSTPQEELMKYLIPETALEQQWWKQSIVARNIGRTDLRIHGTGRKNRSSWSAYYPFVRTAGCVTVREGKYNGVNYIDQRTLLNKMMTVSGLNPSSANETKLYGLLYVVDVDRQERAVSAQDVTTYIGL